MKDQSNVDALCFVPGTPVMQFGSSQALKQLHKDASVIAIESDAPVAVRQAADQVANVRKTGAQIVLIRGAGVSPDTLEKVFELCFIEELQARGQCGGWAVSQ